ncbi:uncharacterized protein LOC122387259 [Amphibalanus amphitrite]|uniref:uncharacterized protein LOC122387259 n=1 Tax=Amphibalanus amphitrite TaxID=1232801 RepID=UPI001C91B482|nr:uncharacterized protein LOC122387259 [Amphibalanus amphitrite]
MGLSTLFGGNASPRQRQAVGLKQIRHTGRPQRLSLGRQLRTLMCFTTEEKLSRGGASGDKRRCKSGSLSQRLRLSESCEEQSGCSQLDTLTGLVVRPSTCPPPQTDGEQPAPLAEQPSSFTLSSLNEEQLNSYLTVLLRSCSATDGQSPAAAGKRHQSVCGTVVEIETQPPEPAQSAADDAAEEVSSAPPAAPKPTRRPTRRECEELIRRHEQLFGPIVSSRPAPVPDIAYLHVPCHSDAEPRDPEWDAWRPHFSVSPDGVWRVVGSDTSDDAECPPPPPSAAAEEAPPADAGATRRRRLLGALRNRWASLVRAHHKSRAPDPVPAGDTPIEPETAPADGEPSEAVQEKVLSEATADDLLRDMADAEVAACTAHEGPHEPAELPRPDPLTYRVGAFRPWNRFFGRPAVDGASTGADETSPPDRKEACETSQPDPVAHTEAAHSGAGAAGGPPPSLWWGLPPPPDAGRPPSRRERRPPPVDRQQLWLNRPELAQLFAAAGLGPADMTRWVLCVPREPEDDAVPPPPPQVTEGSPMEPRDRRAPPATPREKFFEELMGTPPAEPSTESPAELCDRPHNTRPTAGDGVVIQQTNTADIATPATQFAAGWGGPAKSGTLNRDQAQRDETRISIDLGALACQDMPMCSDVCTFLLPEYQEGAVSGSLSGPTSPRDAREPYETYGTEQWGRLGTRRPARRHKPASPAPAAQPVGRFDSETELGAHLSEWGRAAPGPDSHESQLRNSSVRPIDSEVDIAQVLHEQSGYATLGETAAPAAGGYQALPLHEVDSETELGLALPLTDPERPLGAARHRQVTAYDSETEVGALLRSLHATDSETEMGERLRRLSERSGEGAQPEQRRAVAPSDSMTRLPAAPVQVDSETEMGVVLSLFEQGMLSSRYFAGVQLPDEPQSADLYSSVEGEDEKADGETSVDRVGLPMPLDDIYDASKRVSQKVIKKALFLLGCDPLSRPLARTGSSPFGTSAGLDGIELERDGTAADGDRHSPLSAAEGACDPQRVIPEVRLTTSDGSLVVLFPSRPADTGDTGYYETDEGLVVRLQKRPPRPVAESRGFQPTEAGLSQSERELSTVRRQLADRCADAALRRRSPSPRACSDDGGLRVLYRADGAEPWQPVSPEGLSGLSLTPTDPELAALRWRKSSRGEDGDPEAWSAGGESATPPPAESQSQTELRKEKAAPPPGVGGANSWC